MTSSRPRRALTGTPMTRPSTAPRKRVRSAPGRPRNAPTMAIMWMSPTPGPASPRPFPPPSLMSQGCRRPLPRPAAPWTWPCHPEGRPAAAQQGPAQGELVGDHHLPGIRERDSQQQGEEGGRGQGCRREPQADGGAHPDERHRRLHGGYCTESGVAQCRQRPRSATHPRMGTLSCHATGVPQTGTGGAGSEHGPAGRPPIDADVEERAERRTHGECPPPQERPVHAPSARRWRRMPAATPTLRDSAPGQEGHRHRRRRGRAQILTRTGALVSHDQCQPRGALEHSHRHAAGIRHPQRQLHPARPRPGASRHGPAAVRGGGRGRRRRRARPWDSTDPHRAGKGHQGMGTEGVRGAGQGTQLPGPAPRPPPAPVPSEQGRGQFVQRPARQPGSHEHPLRRAGGCRPGPGRAPAPAARRSGP